MLPALVIEFSILLNADFLLLLPQPALTILVTIAALGSKGDTIYIIYLYYRLKEGPASLVV